MINFLANKKQIFKPLAIVIATSLSAEAMASCVIDSVHPATAFTGDFAQSQATLSAALNAMDLGVNKALELQTAVVSTAVNTLTSQKAVGTVQLSKAIKDNTQLEATAEQQIAQNERVKKALRDYGPRGMGFEVCKVLAERQKIARTSALVDKDVFRLVNSEVTAAPGRYASSSNALGVRLALRNKLYCTDGQARGNLCSGNAPRPGNDLKAEALFVPALPGSAAYDDKVAFINNMAGLPFDPVPSTQVGTLQGLTYSDLARRVSAIKSTALTTLKTIQSKYSIPADVENDNNQTAASAPNNSQGKNSTTTEKTILASGTTAPAAPANPAQDLPLALQVKKDVNRYLGSGQEYKEWSQTLVSLEEKGVLAEILREKALRLHIQAEEYKTLQQMEAMLAAAASAETYNVGMDNKLERQRQQVVNRNIRRAINGNSQ